MNLHNGSKIVAKKNILGVISVGDVCMLLDANDSIITFAFGENFTNKGVMTVNEFMECFEEVIEKPTTPTVNPELIEEILDNSNIVIQTVFDKCTVVACQLPNGFVIVESSACVSPENYNEDMGVEICMGRIVDKIWELEAYRLQEELYEENYPCDECPCDGCCGECYDESVDEKDDDDDWNADCSNCDDTSCPEHPNYRPNH